MGLLESSKELHQRATPKMIKEGKDTKEEKTKQIKNQFKINTYVFIHRTENGPVRCGTLIILRSGQNRRSHGNAAGMS